jgi:hypothetical protein
MNDDRDHDDDGQDDSDGDGQAATAITITGDVGPPPAPRRPPAGRPGRA